MISDLAGAINYVISQLQGPRAVVESIVFSGSNVQVPVAGQESGLIFDYIDEFPQRLSFTMRGGISGRPSDTLSISLLLDPNENPGLRERAEIFGDVTPEGNFTLEVTCGFNQSGRYRLAGPLTIHTLSSAIPVGHMNLEIPNLNWFLNYILRDTTEVDNRAFLAMVRKALLPAPAFDFVIGQSEMRRLRPLFQNEPSLRPRVQAGSRRLRVGGESINIAHVLVGIEGGRRQNPTPFNDALNVWPISFIQGRVEDFIRPETLLTWAGDLARPLQELYVDHFLADSYLPGRLDFGASTRRCLDLDRDSLRIGCLARLSASQPDLIGDIDGINLAAVYNPANSLASTLRGYYESEEYRNRFRLLLERSLTWEESPRRGLMAEQRPDPDGSLVLRLTEASSEFLRGEIAQVARALIVTRLFQAYRAGDLNSSPSRLADTTSRLQNVISGPPFELQPTSLVVRQLAQIFIDVVEQGLNGRILG